MKAGEAFIGLLNGPHPADSNDVAVALTDAPPPPGHRHSRLFNGTAGEDWHHTLLVEEDRAITLHGLEFGALSHPTLKPSRYRGRSGYPTC